jgi:hypothetical protein
VIERWAERSRCALLCSNGRYHVARVLNGMPGVSAPLHGDRPHLGFGVLVCGASGMLFRVIFESINEAQPALGTARKRMVPPATKRPGQDEVWNND